MAGLQHGEATAQGIAVRSDKVQDRRAQQWPGGGGESDQNDPFAAGPCDECEPAEVLVLGEDNAPLARGQRDDLGVHGLAYLLGEGANIVTGCAEGAHHRKVEVLVGQEARGGALHRAGKYDDRISRIAKRGLDVVVRQSRVRIENVRFRRPLRHAKDALDGDPGAAYHRLTLKDGGVDLDSIGRHRQP
jgi:hypothetical protein